MFLPTSPAKHPPSSSSNAISAALEMNLTRPIIQTNIFLANKVISSRYFPKKSILVLLVCDQQQPREDSSAAAVGVYSLVFLENRKDENSFQLIDSFPCNEALCGSFTTEFLELIDSIELVDGPSHPFFFQSNELLPSSDYPTQSLLHRDDGNDALFFHLMIVSDDFTSIEETRNQPKKLFHFLSFRFSHQTKTNALAPGKKVSHVQWISYFHYSFDDQRSQQEDDDENFVYPLELSTPCSLLREFFYAYQFQQEFLLISFRSGQAIVIGWISKVVSQLTQIKAPKTMVNLQLMHEMQLETMRNSFKVTELPLFFLRSSLILSIY
jgi:hypothetical protein